MLDRKSSIAVGLAMIGVVYGVYDNALPTVSDSKAVNPNNPITQQSETSARWVSGALVVLVSVVTRDPTVFVLGGSAVVAFSWMHRHANLYNPSSGLATMPRHRQTVEAGVAATAGDAGVMIGVGGTY